MKSQFFYVVTITLPLVISLKNTVKRNNRMELNLSTKNNSILWTPTPQTFPHNLQKFVFKTVKFNCVVCLTIFV